MSNFDWSKVTAEQLRDVPQAVVGDGFKIVNYNAFPSLYYNGTFAATIWLGMWKLSMQSSEAARAALACIDRIANYLRMQAKSL